MKEKFKEAEEYKECEGVLIDVHLGKGKKRSFLLEEGTHFIFISKKKDPSKEPDWMFRKEGKSKVTFYSKDFKTIIWSE